VTPTDLSAVTGTSPATDNPSVYYGSDTAPVEYGGVLDNLTLTLTQQQKYIAAGDIAIQLTNSGLTSTQRNDLSVALWDIFNPLSATDGGLAQFVDAGVESDLTNALTATLSGGTLGGYDVTAGTQSSGGAPQEFIDPTYVPEPSTWAFLGFDFAGAGIVGLYFRRRKSAILS
jgi:hypothetical protein